MSYNTPVRRLQDGSILEVTTGGTIQSTAGSATSNLTAFAFGTAVMGAGGSVNVLAGFPITSAIAVPVGTVGSFTAVTSVRSGWTTGTAIFLGLTGTQAVGGGGTISYMIFG